MNYFVEFEFKGLYPYLYWLPVQIEAGTPEQAEDYATRLQTALMQNYELKSRSRAIPIFDSINSSRIQEYRKARAVGTPVILNVRQWTMRSVEGAPDIPFEKQSSNEIGAVPGSLPNADGPCTLATGVERRFPAYLVAADRDLGEEFLLINVVMPRSQPTVAGDASR